MADQTTTDSPAPIAEISHGPSALETFLDKNQKLLILIGLAAALGIGAAVVIRGLEEGAHLDGGSALMAANDIDSLKAVSTDHASTPSASSAAVLLSDEQWDQGLQSESIDTLNAEIAANPEHPATIPARARLGARLVEQGDLDQAEQVFQALVDDATASYIAPYALIRLADIATSRGENEKAKQLLTEANENYPANSFNRTISMSQRFVGFQMPTEIDPPAPEPIVPEAAVAPAADVPAPDLSTPVELDPTQSATGGNPLLDSLGTEDAGDIEAPAEPAEAPAETDTAEQGE